GTVDSQYPVGDPIWNTMGYRGHDAGHNLKSVSGWFWGGNGSGLYGYEVLPGGWRIIDGAFFSGVPSYALLWSSTQGSSGESWARYLHYGSNGVNRNNHDKDCGLSVRCLHD
ncbi:MAG: hypothetical protein K8R53_11750, partial [Bacteroidales bacterium]|nr:hypothetical protein [Bacteroidales bacterium]